MLIVCALLQAGAVQSAAARQASPLAAEPLNASPTIDRDRVDRQAPALPRAPRAPETPKPPVVDDRAASAVGGITLSRLRYEGSSLPAERLNAAVALYVGQPLNRDNLQKIVNAINAVYAESDVALYGITIPRQVVANGELVLRITEGRISQYAIKKETRSTPTRLIAAHMNRLMADQPTSKSELERTLSLLRDIPGQTVDAQFRTIGKPDEVALDLNVKRKQIDIALNINNNGVLNVVTGVQAQLSVGIHGLLREGDSTRVSGYLPFNPERYQFYSLSHSTPIGSNGLYLSASGAHVRSRTRDMDIRGEVTQAGLGLSYPVIRSYRRNLSISLSLDGINSDNYFLDTAFGAFRTRVVRGSATWSSVGKRGGYAVSGTLSQGLDALGARPFVGFSEAKFAKANLQLTAVRELGKRFAVKLTSRGQYTRDLLPTTERFSLGGEDAGMAFQVGTVTAERALAGSLELSWKRKEVKNGRGGFTVFAYGDGALGHAIARPFYGLPARDYSLASAGVGARITPFGGWTASAQIAVPVKQPFDNNRTKTRFFFSISRAV